ncbi:hypothetical protein [Streptomyces avermitilis]|uniref:hypothetical protein n=1 Tax=Streptomyces avermitilis TaxID=33903 RepID=UPI003530CBD5
MDVNATARQNGIESTYLWNKEIDFPGGIQGRFSRERVVTTGSAPTRRRTPASTRTSAAGRTATDEQQLPPRPRRTGGPGRFDALSSPGRRRRGTPSSDPAAPGGPAAAQAARHEGAPPGGGGRDFPPSPCELPCGTGSFSVLPLDGPSGGEHIGRAS